MHVNLTLKLLHTSRSNASPKLIHGSTTADPASPDRPGDGAGHCPVPQHLEDRFLGLFTPSSLSWGPSPSLTDPTFPLREQTFLTSTYRPATPPRRRRSTPAPVASSRRRPLVGGRWGPRGGAGSAGGGVTCRPPLGGGRGRGVAEKGGLLGDLVLCEQLRAGQVHVPAGRKPSSGSWGRATTSAKPGKAGSWTNGDGAGWGAAEAPPRGRAASTDPRTLRRV